MQSVGAFRKLIYGISRNSDPVMSIVVYVKAHQWCHYKDHYIDVDTDVTLLVIKDTICQIRFICGICVDRCIDNFCDMAW